MMPSRMALASLFFPPQPPPRAVDCGGLGVIQLLVKQLELAETIDQRVKVLERHLPYRESDHVLNLIYNVMTGGSCLQDVEARRRDPVYLDALGARKVPGRKVWSNQDKEFHRQVTIDVDGTDGLGGRHAGRACQQNHAHHYHTVSHHVMPS